MNERAGVGLFEVQRAAPSRADRAADVPSVRQADAGSVDCGIGRDPEDLLLSIEDMIADYGRAEFRAGRAGATDYVRAQTAAETEKDRLLNLIRNLIYPEGPNV